MLDRQEMDVPSGEITWVSLPNKMVWINRGRADALQRQTKFTVYSAESTNAAKAVKKGTVEVVRIDGDHSAQARILEDKLADPIMAGDKVFTPLWSPGQQNHFALTGIMNLDGDGRNQLNVVRGLINQNGGEVDCWLDEQGHKQGQHHGRHPFRRDWRCPRQEFAGVREEPWRYPSRCRALPGPHDDAGRFQAADELSEVELGGAFCRQRSRTTDVSQAALATKAGKAAKAAPPKSATTGIK